MLSAARQPGPARWTSHCGGEPLSPHAVWGGGDRRVFPCTRHGAADRAPWTRASGRSGDVDRALGGRVDELRVGAGRRPLALLAVRAAARRCA